MIRFDMRSMIVFTAALGTSLVCAGVLYLVETPEVSARAIGRPIPMATPAVLKAADGHYWAEASIEGRNMRMLVDTGASLVTISRSDARKLGIILNDNDFTQDLATAAGNIKASPVALRTLSVAGVRIDNVDALVVDRDLPAPLLGMSYLGRLSAFEARPDGLVLKN